LARLEKAYAEFTAGRLARNAWPVSQWRDYVRCVTPDTTPRGDFDQRLIVLRRVGGEGRPDLVQAPAFVRALRETLMSKADGNAKAMPWISGHEPDGRPCQRPHVAALPLAHVGHEHADGHLLGMGIAFPRGMPADDEHAVSEVIAHTMDSEGQIELKAGALGTMLLKAEDGPSPAYALRSATWTRASLCWGTVTPIALDRLPPRRHEGDDAWVAAQVVAACERQGLPAPVEVCILPVSPHIGAPTCGAFPPLRRKPDGANRWHVHAVLVFARLVEGPLALGAGRYQGYGLLKPLAGAERGRASAADAAQVPMHTPSS
jgi:CRISPR-associated protein Csb2